LPEPTIQAKEPVAQETKDLSVARASSKDPFALIRGAWDPISKDQLYQPAIPVVRSDASEPHEKEESTALMLAMGPVPPPVKGSVFEVREKKEPVAPTRRDAPLQTPPLSPTTGQEYLDVGSEGSSEDEFTSKQDYSKETGLETGWEKPLNNWADETGSEVAKTVGIKPAWSQEADIGEKLKA